MPRVSQSSSQRHLASRHWSAPGRGDWELAWSVACIGHEGPAIGAHHRDLELPDPIRHPTITQVRRGLRRTLGTAPRRPAHALNLAEITTITAAIEAAEPVGARDRALILLGFASALRPGELAALTLTDLETQPGGVLLHVRRSKTDQEAHGEIVAVASGRHTATCPTTALKLWLRERGPAPGPLFTAFRNHHAPTDDPISAHAVSRIVTRRAHAAGLPDPRITGHSLRAGHATTAAANGVTLDRIAAQTRHRHLRVLIEHYIRPMQALTITTSPHHHHQPRPRPVGRGDDAQKLETTREFRCLLILYQSTPLPRRCVERSTDVGCDLGSSLAPHLDPVETTEVERQLKATLSKFDARVRRLKQAPRSAFVTPHGCGV